MQFERALGHSSKGQHARTVAEEVEAGYRLTMGLQSTRMSKMGRLGRQEVC
jgi:hypothetical protein